MYHFTTEERGGGNSPMEKIALLLIFCGFCLGRDINIDTRYAGIVTDLKLTDGFIYIKTDRKIYTTDINVNCYLNIGDTLYEYWIEYQKDYVGNKNCFLKLKK